MKAIPNKPAIESLFDLPLSLPYSDYEVSRIKVCTYSNTNKWYVIVFDIYGRERDRAICNDFSSAVQELGAYLFAIGGERLASEVRYSSYPHDDDDDDEPVKVRSWQDAHEFIEETLDD